MKILEKTETKLIIQRKPILERLLYLMGCLLVSILLYLSLLLPIHSKITCTKLDRNRVDCELQESSLLHFHLNKRIIHNLIEATKAYSKNASESISLKTYQKFLTLPFYNFAPSINFPSSTFFIWDLDWSKRDRQIDRINSFIRESQENKTLEVSRNLSYFMYPLFFIFGIFLPIVFDYFFIKQILLFPTETYIFDRDRSQLVISNSNLFERKKQEYPFQNIVGVFLELELLPNTDKYYVSKKKNYCLYLKFVSGINYLIDEFDSNREAREYLEMLKLFLHISYCL